MLSWFCTSLVHQTNFTSRRQSRVFYFSTMLAMCQTHCEAHVLWKPSSWTYCRTGCPCSNPCLELSVHQYLCLKTYVQLNPYRLHMPLNQSARWMCIITDPSEHNAYTNPSEPNARENGKEVSEEMRCYFCLVSIRSVTERGTRRQWSCMGVTGNLIFKWFYWNSLKKRFEGNELKVW